MVPTALHHYTIAEIESTEKGSEPLSWPFNAKLGRFTNFVNLMDMCGISVPSGIQRCQELSVHDSDGMPACACSLEVHAERQLLQAVRLPQPLVHQGRCADWPVDVDAQVKAIAQLLDLSCQ